jgi:hypothetical protein
MQFGLVPDGFPRNEMLFDVAQSGSLNAEAATGQRVLVDHDPESFRSIINRKARNSDGKLW